MQAKETNEKNEKVAYFLRPDLQESLKHNRIKPSNLSTFQRIILTADGTLTELLETYLCEKLQIVKLSEKAIVTDQVIEALDIPSGSELIDRKILLRGKISRVNWIYAQSFIVPDRLEARFRERLLVSQEPIGRLWVEHRAETFKEIIESAREVAGDLADYFKIDKEERLLSRTYRVFSNRQPVMMITEKFPESYFKSDFC